MKISELTAATSLSTSDTLVVVQGGVTKKAAISTMPSTGSVPSGCCTLEQFGAVGDGTTDDSAALIAAMAAILAGTYKALILGAKTYLVSSGAAVPSNCAIIGQGWKSILKTTGTVGVLRLSASNDVVMRNFQILGDKISSTQWGISLGDVNTIPAQSGQERVLIDGVYFNTLYKGLLAQGNNGGHDGPQIANCKFYNNSYGVWVDSGSEFLSFTGCHCSQNNTGVYWAAGNLQWIGGVVNYNVTGFSIQSGTNDSHSIIADAMIDHNTTTLNVGAIANGLTIQGCHMYQGDITIVGNTGLITIVGGILDPGTYTLTNALVRFVDVKLDTAYFVAYTPSGTSDIEWGPGCRKLDNTIPSYIGATQYLIYTFASDANQTFNAQQSRAAVIDVQAGVISVSRSITLARPPNKGQFITVINRDSHNITVQWSSGTGVTVVAGNRADIGADGTNATRLLNAAV